MTTKKKLFIIVMMSLGILGTSFLIPQLFGPYSFNFLSSRTAGMTNPTLSAYGDHEDAALSGVVFITDTAIISSTATPPQFDQSTVGIATPTRKQGIVPPSIPSDTPNIPEISIPIPTNSKTPTSTATTTQTATATRTPTLNPTPTNSTTPLATGISSPQPTHTPTTQATTIPPTNTAIPQPTNTHRATFTPRPSPTPKPTNTPKPITLEPTNTPMPSPTNTSTPQ